MSNKKEYAIGEELNLCGRTGICTEVVENKDCCDCCFDDYCDASILVGNVTIGTYCFKETGTDNKDVIFKLKEE